LKEMKGGLLTILVLLIIVHLSHGDSIYGVDVSIPISEDAWSCLLASNYTFAIVRAWRSLGIPDLNCPASVSAAWEAGLDEVDVYFFPCFSCGNASGQVDDAINFLHDNKVKFELLWFDIEGPDYWSEDQTENQEFMSELLDEALILLGDRIGIYTSKYEWTTIMDNWDECFQFPLWYAHYDGEPNFDDFVPFGNWTAPTLKQFNGDVNLCNVNVDVNFGLY